MNHSFFYHGSNIEAKISGNYKDKGSLFQEFKEKYYSPFREEQLKIHEYDDTAIRKRTELLALYYRDIDKFNSGGWVSSQSKLRSTVIEEFCGYLFLRIPELEQLGLDFFNKHIFSGMAISNEGDPIIKTKDVDFCIGKKFNVDIGGIIKELIIPLIAIECKTYVDKTMFNEAQFSAQKLKQGSPNVRTFIIAGRNEIDKLEIPIKGQTPIDQIFIIGGDGTTHIEVDHDAILEFYHEVREILQNFSNLRNIPNTGKLLLE